MITEKNVTGNAVVIGAGTMGGGIAAQLANAGWTVKLLDIAGPDPDDKKTRSQAANAGLERVKKNKPVLLFAPEFASKITPGNIEDHSKRLSEADWILEAVAEKIPIKQSVMELIEKHANPKAVITTNTSGLALSEIVQGRSADFKKRFFGSHFFNPPRYLNLVELILLPETDKQIADGFSRFSEQVLGRNVVPAKDTPGFISNRLGMWTLLDTIHTAVEMGLNVEEVDYLTGPFIGRPKSGTFRLADVIGFDIITDITRHQYERLTHDAQRDRLLLPAVMEKLIADGKLGAKTEAGFYKREGKNILSLDLNTLAYRPRVEPDFPEVEALMKAPLEERLKAIANEKSTRWGSFVNSIINNFSNYVNQVSSEIADDVRSIDLVMKGGFNWQLGPFEMEDIVQGTQKHYAGSGSEKRYRTFAQNELQPLSSDITRINLRDLKSVGKTVLETNEASLLDMGDGIACLEFHTKMNTFNPQLTDALNNMRERAEKEFQALVIGNQGAHFSAGYNIKLFIDAAKNGEWSKIDGMLNDVQESFLSLKYASIPIVAAPFGYTLGAGCEGVLHCAAIQAGAELNIGLPETSIGVIPAGGGTKELLARAVHNADRTHDLFPKVEAVFDVIVPDKNSANAYEAKKMGFLRENDGITLNPDRLLYDAKKRALSLSLSGYQPTQRENIWVLGEEGRARLQMPIHWHYRSGVISEYSKMIAEKVAYILSGGDVPYAQEVSEDYLLKLEREVFIELAHEPKTIERMESVLATGKPVKN